MAYNSRELFVIKSFGIDMGEAETGFLPAKGSETSAPPRCPLCGSALALRVWNPPYKVEMRFWGPKHGDLVQFTNDVLVSERLVWAIQGAGLTGMDILTEASVTKVRPSKMAKGMPRYFVGRIKRSNAMFDDVASRAEYKRMWTCDECKTGEIVRFRSVVLVQDSWQGEDLFIAKGLPGIFLASGRFHDLVIAHGFQNINLVRASAYGIDWMPGSKKGPT
jgi:hypothetical protein